MMTTHIQDAHFQHYTSQLYKIVNIGNLDLLHLQTITKLQLRVKSMLPSL